MVEGEMRQSDVIATADLFALNQNIKRRQEDHDDAKWLAGALREAQGINAASISSASKHGFPKRTVCTRPGAPRLFAATWYKNSSHESASPSDP